MSNAPLLDARLQPMTLDEWAALPDDEMGELVDGYLVEEEMPNNTHEIVVSWLIALFHLWGRARGAIVLASGAKYAVAKNRGRMPDVSVFLATDPKPPRTRLNRRPPTIAIEIVSSTPRDARRDRVAKLAEYAAFGVRFYWLVDPWLRSFQIHERNADGHYVHLVDVTDGVIEEVPGCEGLRVEVSALWAEIDALGEDDE